MKSGGRTQISWLRRCVLIALPIVLFAILWVVHWFYAPRISSLERQARQYAGWSGIGATNCGYVYGDGLAGEIPHYAEAIRKAVSAYKQGKPFSIQYLYDLRDKQDAFVLIGTRNGGIYELQQTTYEIGRGHVSGPVSIENLSHLRDGDFATNLKRHLETGD